MNEITSEETTDICVALNLAGHIAHPSMDRRGWEMKRVYMSEARKFAGQIKNETAKEIIGAVLRVYSH